MAAYFGNPVFKEIETGEKNLDCSIIRRSTQVVIVICDMV